MKGAGETANKKENGNNPKEEVNSGQSGYYAAQDNRMDKQNKHPQTS
ncbi:hypothetical protein FACS1894137_00380 [Spirochaetia bacterium]|nr:hypothetical protein FACS1894137_00380 [Spirochaetia bacterium]